MTHIRPLSGIALVLVGLHDPGRLLALEATRRERAAACAGGAAEAGATHRRSPRTVSRSIRCMTMWWGRCRSPSTSQARHASGHRAALQRRLRGDRPRQSRCRSSGCRARAARSWCPRSSSCRARRARASSSTWRRCASSIFRRPRKARSRWSTRIRSASARSAGPRPEGRDQGRLQAEGSGLDADRPRYAPSTRPTAKSCPTVVPAGPDNPLGKYKFTLGWPSYLIHGTNKPYGVGLRSSHGCIRLYPEDVEKLFGMIGPGTPGRGREPAVRVRLARRPAVPAGL